VQREITCVIGDDHDALRTGVIAMLRHEDGIDVVGDADTGEGILALAERRHPDVTIVDVTMGAMDGLEVCREATKRGVPTAVLVYSGRDDLDVLDSALDAGAAGYVLKSSPIGELIRAVRTVAQGSTWIDGRLAAELLRRRRDREGPILSPREQQILQLLAAGRTTDEAAAELFLSPATVRSYIESAMGKLGARNRLHAVAQALRAGLIS
jgi:two-component system nitrate/nitrite response regulator NarL